MINERERFSIFIMGKRALYNAAVNEEFVDGHLDVLKNIGVEKVTSEETDWQFSRNSIVIVARSLSTQKLVAGSRIDICGKDISIPVEDAIKVFDTNVHQYILENAPIGMGEMCGLWTSPVVSGMGIATALTRASIAIAPYLELTKLIALCSFSSKTMLEKMGGTPVTELGDKGTFRYPNSDLIATLLCIPDVHTIEFAEQEARERILRLRNNLQLKTIEHGTKGETEIEYDLNLDDINEDTFQFNSESANE